MNDAIIDQFEALIAAYLANSTDANIDAVEDFEAANPGVADASYQRGVKADPYHYI